MTIPLHYADPGERQAAVQRRPRRDLGYLISPLSADEFIADTWERSHVLIKRGEPAYYAGLLSFDDVDQILATSDLRHANMRVVRQGQEVPINTLIGTQPGATANSLEIVYQQYRSGSTLVLNALHERWAPLGELCRSLSAEMSSAAQVNVYLTPPGGQGFTAHYDTHDVFVAQMHGRKRWRVYEPPIELPLRSQTYRSLNLDGPVAIIDEFDLEAGDLLYLPRGHVHEAFTNEGASLHLTIGVTPVTWGALVLDAVDQVIRREPRFRRGLPPGFASGETARAELIATAGDVAADLAQRLDAASLAETACEWAALSRKATLRGHLTDLEESRSLDGATRIRRRPALRWRPAAEADGTQVGIRFHGKTVLFPSRIEPALEFILDRDEFTLQDIPARLDGAGKRVLVNTLVQEGFLTLSERSPTD
jgi:ribosomal protein L16 Arg81 hydroxylase